MALSTSGDPYSPMVLTNRLAEHSFGKVPTLEVDGAVIYENSVITGYLDTVVANNKFSPADPLARARIQ